VTAGSSVTIRLRSFHKDLTDAKLRIYDLNANGQSLVPMTIAASNVPCFEAGLEQETCDFWEATVSRTTPNNLWYRFVVSDGADTDFYGDNTAALDGGIGSASEEVIDNSYALMFYSPNFRSPTWAKNAVIYQIFPDRFRNGNRNNDPKTGDPRYDDPVIALPWNTLPEGYCRNYADGATNCPWRYDTTPPATSPSKEQPRGRDYYGGDLRGVIQKLDYLKEMGVTAIYFNPIFFAKSNHRYDTYDYMQIDPALGTLRDFQTLTRAARERGIVIILDSVFNHMSSDSPQFDRYGQYATVGACESASSIYRDWFNFRAPTGSEPAPCAPSTVGGNDTYYQGWFGFDSIPEIKKNNPSVISYFLSAPNSVSRYWLRQGALGWRLDVMGDQSFPSGYWESFRQIVRNTNSNALIIGELWQKDSTLLRHLRGETADSTMNYRMRDAILGLLTPAPFDSKGFADSGRQIEPSEFAARLASIREDYPDAAYYTLMNLVGSHDTERVLWTLTPGEETNASKTSAANLADGKRRLQIASLIQYSMPGAPTVYYGDEVGVTGDDDPDDRRTYPWRDQGGRPDNTLLKHYQELGDLRKNYTVLSNGDFRVLQADDSNDTVAIGRRNAKDAAILLINRSTSTRTVRVPVAGFLGEGVGLESIYCIGSDLNVPVFVRNRLVEVTLSPMGAMLLHTRLGEDLQAPNAPNGLNVLGESDSQVNLSWNSVAGASGYNLYRSVVRGGGYQLVNATPLTGTSFSDSGLQNASDYYYIVKAVDTIGNESSASNEVRATPKYLIGWSNLQWPPSITHTISTNNRTTNVYGQVWIDGVTSQPGQTSSLRAQLGFGPDGSDPTSSAWSWIEASFNGNAGNNDEFVASLLPEVVGSFDYTYRYTTDNGRSWIYADLDGSPNGYSPSQAGSLTVQASGDSSAPSTPTNLQVLSASPAAVDLSWSAASDDTALYGYEVLRSGSAGGPYTQIARITSTSYSDTSVTEGATYYYVVRALDASFNRSGNSNEVQAQALQRTVTVTFNVNLNAPVPNGSSVYIAGFLDRLDGGLPQWNPGGVVLTQVSPTQWTITVTGKEGTEIEYKYALGSWDFVEKGNSCDEIANRRLILSYGSNGIQTVNDSVPNWRNVAPCGN
jgi:glycosidase/fibronectin type 3 domain-containing protein